MHTFDNTTADTHRLKDIEVARWEQFALGDAMPFQAMWYTVPPGSSSPPDCHPEVELSLVVSGVAAAEVGGRTTQVEQGGAFLLESDETHIVHNLSSDRPLLIFSAYWMPAELILVADNDMDAVRV
jgi:quercetin dioxygenase-like cupin family protein